VLVEEEVVLLVDAIIVGVVEVEWEVVEEAARDMVMSEKKMGRVKRSVRRIGRSRRVGAPVS
jgi:hypothetical protein